MPPVRSTNLSPPTLTSTTPTTNRAALSVVTTLFFMWGFLTCLNDILVPHLKSIFDLNYAQVMLIQFAFFSAYFIFSIPSAKVIDWIGYQKTMVVGLIIMALGAVLFIPAASVPSFPLFLGALMVLAAGITALQVAANPYVSVLGPPRTASSRLNLTQAFNSLGTFLAPWFGKVLIMSTAALGIAEMRQLSPDALQAYRLHEAATVKSPYLGLAIALLVLGILIGRFKLPAMPAAQHRVGDKSAGSVWKYPHLVLGAVGIFVYVGAEVAIGSFLVNYFSQSNIGNVSEKVAAGLFPTTGSAPWWDGSWVPPFCRKCARDWCWELPRWRRLRWCAFRCSLSATSLCGASSWSVFSTRSCSPAYSRWESPNWDH